MKLLTFVALTSTLVSGSGWPADKVDADRKVDEFDKKMFRQRYMGRLTANFKDETFCQQRGFIENSKRHSRMNGNA